MLTTTVVFIKHFPISAESAQLKIANPPLDITSRANLSGNPELNIGEVLVEFGAHTLLSGMPSRVLETAALIGRELGLPLYPDESFTDPQDRLPDGTVLGPTRTNKEIQDQTVAGMAYWHIHDGGGEDVIVVTCRRNISAILAKTMGIETEAGIGEIIKTHYGIASSVPMIKLVSPENKREQISFIHERNLLTT
jgi:hypothetical protein